MILTEEVEIKMNPKTFKHYKNLGYDIKVGEIIKVPIEHLTRGSHSEIKCLCEGCGDMKYLKYKDYLKNLEKYDFYVCHKCCIVKKKRLL